MGLEDKMENDKLDRMFEIQHKAQESRGTWEKIKGSESMKQQFINQMLLACQEEVVEIMRETAYKNPEYVPFGWKQKQVWNEENYKNEIIDLWHFVMNLYMSVGGTSEDFYKRYLEKNKENLERWSNGY
jgi:dimeric dUTPase (all-alpha-NTP-PPase superfamily)